MRARSAYPDYLWEWAADRADQDGLTAAAVDQRFGYLMSVAVDKNSELVPQIRPDWDLIVRLRRDLGVENLAKLWPPTPDTFLKHMRTVRKATKEPQISGTLIESNGNLSPNPPKDTDGRGEDSGRGWERELQGRWPGVLG